MDNFSIILGDSSDEMVKLMDNGVKVDLTVTSPPYGFDKGLRSYEGKVSWNWDKFTDIANKLYQITADGGVVIWNVADKTENGSESGDSFKEALYFKEIGFLLYDTMIFQKANYIPLSHRRYEQSFEYLFCFSKGKPKTFNPIMIPCKNAGKIENYGSKRRNVLDAHQAMRAREEEVICRATKDTKIHPNVFEYTLGGAKTGHPAAFPDKLAHDQIISWSNEGDIVFDPFLGSGTTGVEALKLDRKFIGIEIVQDYYDIASNRINLFLKEKQ